ncbi:MAG: anhydro-N-acetylmuramic acid kinase [Flavobacteriaceae bacterium]|jgi:anhydro-N-acetylmuramic acid kinase|uniref:anhydro-N-acetylmuramic acid kinase n=1 Tax=Candidatus Marifrigoribacter sp. Uisw_064 TaxID=3230970 RepID=UPI003AE4496D
MLQNEYKVIGVMSGTSLDGIDLAELHFSLSESTSWDFNILTTETIPYPSDWIKRLKEGIAYSEENLELLNKDYTLYLSEIIKKFIAKNELKNIDAVCSHGHTILHQPNKGITLQIGNLPELANLIQQKVVCDFRMQDVELGGQGAPLVPIGDQLLFYEYDYCLNLGGFANVSLERDGKRIAYDICAVNVVLNKYANELGFDYDDQGKIAKGGTFNLSVSGLLGTVPFYNVLPPKSLGMEWVDQEIFPILDAQNIYPATKLRTYTDHIARQIARQFHKDTKVLVTGGGAFNSYLLSKIKQYKKVELILPSKELIEYKEALIFGLLGVLKLRGEVNSLSSVTGAKKDHSSGKIYLHY